LVLRNERRGHSCAGPPTDGAHPARTLSRKRVKRSSLLLLLLLLLRRPRGDRISERHPKPTFFSLRGTQCAMRSTGALARWGGYLGAGEAGAHDEPEDPREGPRDQPQESEPQSKLLRRPWRREKKQPQNETGAQKETYSSILIKAECTSRHNPGGVI